MGKRLAAEVLLLDKPLNAQEALACGFINGVIPELKGQEDFFDLKTVPAIGKLLS
jgi:enoyl-CoA hydratase/carnithine racemase